MIMKLELSQEEIQKILDILGDTPTRFGVWDLAVKIKEQAEKQLKEK